jgi:hypothetical protein
MNLLFSVFLSIIITSYQDIRTILMFRTIKRFNLSTRFWHYEQDKRKNWTNNELKLSVFCYIILKNINFFATHKSVKSIKLTFW